MWKLLFTVTLRIIVNSLIISLPYTSYPYILGLYVLLAAGSIAIDVLLQRTRVVFLAGVRAFAIFTGIILFIIRPCIDAIQAVFASPVHHELSSPALGALIYVLIILLVLPLLTGLVFAGSEPKKSYIPRICGVAVWTTIYLELEISNSGKVSLEWIALVIYAIGAIVYALLAEFGQFLRVLPERQDHYVRWNEYDERSY